MPVSASASTFLPLYLPLSLPLPLYLPLPLSLPLPLYLPLPLPPPLYLPLPPPLPLPYCPCICLCLSPLSTSASAPSTFAHTVIVLGCPISLHLHQPSLAHSAHTDTIPYTYTLHSTHYTPHTTHPTLHTPHFTLHHTHYTHVKHSTHTHISTPIPYTLTPSTLLPIAHMHTPHLTPCSLPPTPLLLLPPYSPLCEQCDAIFVQHELHCDNCNAPRSAKILKLYRPLGFKDITLE
ncbi:hypothetical protein B484DRAFT_212934 [Ochromonadaceae sp. CCMP2298]|nr:hypothetical protein B484DRAFT_212934 [Ochromonadaceae sp. CCMP2298]